MPFQLVRRRTIWWPTLVGWTVLAVLLGTPALFWWFQGESFLALTQREPAEVLVVEGWIGPEGVRIAKAEFVKGRYAYIVATSGLSGNRWDDKRWSYAAEAEEQLLNMGLPRDRVILATPKDTEAQRTYESAVATREALRARGVRYHALNVFTIGVHSRRSRLVYAKVMPAGTKTGVIGWIPPRPPEERWWRSSTRASEFLKETVGYLLELVLSSGRGVFSKAE